MDASQKRAKRRAKKAAAERKAYEKQQKKEQIEQYKKDRGMGKGGNNLHDFVKTFLVFVLLFTVVFTPIVYAKTAISEISIFGDDNVKLEEKLPLLVSSDSPFYDAFTNSEKINILLLGVNPPLTDTIMLAMLDTKNNRVDVVSVPRDTYYHRDGYNNAASNKINAAYRGDPLNSAYAVSDILLGVPINYYAVVEYDDVEKIVDAIGGVPMDIPFDMVYKDPYDTPPLEINIKQGYQILDGETSVEFLRYRKGYVEGDLGRVKAQQEWVKSAAKQALGMGLGIIDVVKLACNEIDSDITVGAAVKIATSMIGMSPDNIFTYTMPNTPQETAPYYVFPKTEEIEKMMTDIYEIGTEEIVDEIEVTTDGEDGKE